MRNRRIYKLTVSVFLYVFLLVLPFTAMAQGTLNDYQKAEQFLPRNVEKLVSSAWVAPNWIDKSSRFWYRNILAGGKEEFVLIDAEQNTSAPAFDHQKLAQSLTTAQGKQYQPDELPFDSFKYIDTAKSIQFDTDSTRWVCDLTEYELKKIEQTKEPNGLSPDGKWQAFIRAHNLFVRSTENEEEIQLSHDGEDKYDYAFRPAWYKLENESNPQEENESEANVSWSPDSKKISTFRLYRKDVKKLYLYKSMAEKGLRAEVYSYERALPGDSLLAMVEYVIFDVENREQIPVQIKRAEAFLTRGRPRWFKDSKRLYFTKWYRGYNYLQLLEIEAETGKARTLFEERAKTYVDPDLIEMNFVDDGKEIIWASERDGWNHLYLFDGKSGKLKNQITKGEFVVHYIEAVDDSARQIYFVAGGREKDRDPYFRHLYRINFDGSDLTLLSPEDAEHDFNFSPDDEFFVDNYSRVDAAPKSVLRRKVDGKVVRVLEEADISKLLATGWNYPERFKVKGRDGKTDLYGVIFRPTNFDPAIKYPVIDATYSGPQAVRTPKSFQRGYRNNDQPIAELGFIVVTIDGMGTAKRSKAFHDVSHKNLGDIGAPDHIAGLQQLAKRYPYLDLTRVGIYGHSAGGYDAAHALLIRPEFYKVAVSSAGNHDHRMAKVWWPELYMGLLGDHYAEQSNLTLAGNLQGKLLLIHGDLDNNVNTASTLRFAGELIKANKDFDLLLIPNRRHGLSDHRYFIRKRWDYFVKHLFGVEPPKEYEIADFDKDTPTS